MTFRQLQPVSPWKVFLSIVLAFLGFWLFTQGTMFGIIFLGFAISLGIRPGVEIDLDKKRWRRVYSVYAINLGNWTKLPEIEYVSVFKTKKKSRTRLVTAESTHGTVGYRLNLFYNTNKHIEAYFTEDRKDALEVADHIADILETEVYDSTRE